MATKTATYFRNFTTGGRLMQAELNVESSYRNFQHFYHPALTHYPLFYIRLWNHCSIFSLMNIISKKKYRSISMVLKTLWEIEHLLLMNKCSISHVFKCQLQQMRNYASLGYNELGNYLSLYQSIPVERVAAIERFDYRCLYTEYPAYCRSHQKKTHMPFGQTSRQLLLTRKSIYALSHTLSLYFYRYTQNMPLHRYSAYAFT